VGSNPTATAIYQRKRRTSQFRLICVPLWGLSWGLSCHLRGAETPVYGGGGGRLVPSRVPQAVARNGTSAPSLRKTAREKLIRPDRQASGGTTHAAQPCAAEFGSMGFQGRLRRRGCWLSSFSYLRAHAYRPRLLRAACRPCSRGPVRVGLAHVLPASFAGRRGAVEPARPPDSPSETGHRTGPGSCLTAAPQPPGSP
jgi:hypothetical protein